MDFFDNYDNLLTDRDINSTFLDCHETWTEANLQVQEIASKKTPLLSDGIVGISSPYDFKLSPWYTRPFYSFEYF